MKKKEIIELSVTSCLIIVLLFAIVNGAKSVGRTKRLGAQQASKKKVPPAKETRIGQAQDITHVPEGKTLFEKLDEETKDIKPTRDPFSSGPIMMLGTGSHALNLAGILWDEESPKVIINDEILGIGDDIDGNTIVDIRQNKVILNDGSKDFELRL